MHLTKHRGIFLHAAGIADDDRCYLFTGFPGSGKTTIARLAQGRTILADDGIPVKRTGGEFYASSTPWNAMYPPWNGTFGEIVEDVRVDKVFFLGRGSQASFRRLSPSESAARLIRHVIPRFIWLSRFSTNGTRCLLELCSDMSGVVPCYNMCYNLGDDLWGEISRLAEEEVKKP
jgi:hypothetical protein